RQINRANGDLQGSLTETRRSPSARTWKGCAVGHTTILVHNSSGQPTWRLGSNHSVQQWQNKLAQRRWTPQQISEAIANGHQFPAVNTVNPANAATRYVHRTTGRSVVVDNVS